ncbi:crustacean hyperglycemic hormones A* isoform X2 [Copidosoma floridanum]|nr:crustacean hyperglycemic hormones A* isoform X2 [Copidosoma floridanum]
MMHRQQQSTQDSCGAAPTLKQQQLTTCWSTTDQRTTISKRPITRSSSRWSEAAATGTIVKKSGTISTRTEFRRKGITRYSNSTNNSSSSLRYSGSLFSTTCSSLFSSSSSSSNSLLSILAWSMTLLLVSSYLGIADAGSFMGHSLGKRSFLDIQCKGVYDRSLFARLDRICEDCYNLFREPQLHTLCRKNCFTTDYFKGCLDVLLLEDEMEWIKTSIKQLHGADPGV